jgi:hypothetical protein
VIAYVDAIAAQRCKKRGDSAYWISLLSLDWFLYFESAKFFLPFCTMCGHLSLWFVLTSWATKYWLAILFFLPLFIHIGSDLLVFRCIASIYPL